jgi:hypothetical protein
LLPKQNWRLRQYGRITGAQIEQCLNVFREAWVDRESWVELASSEDKWLASVQKLMAVQNWTPFYQITLLELLGKMASLTGILDELVEALKAPDPTAAILDIEVPDDPPDHPAAMPLAFAMVGNLEAIARYSRSINDMILACRGGDLQALFDALSVDSYVSTMAFFQAAMRVGQLSGDAEAAASIFKSIRGPHKKRFDYPELRWTEYLLRDQGAFEACTREEIYDLVVVHLGIYDPAGKKKDSKAALFTLLRAWQKQAGIQNPRFGFSVNRK